MTSLLNLALANRDTAARVICQAGPDGTADVLLKGVISRDFGISAYDLRAAFAEAGGRKVSLYINSPGGDVFEAREMQGIISSHPAEVTAIVRGIAASAATIVSLSASRVVMMRGSRYMIHNGRTIAMGDRHAMAEVINVLQSFDAELAAEYSAKTGIDAGELAAMMDAETWFTADEAKARGFIDEIVSNTQGAVANAARGTWNLSAYANAPAIVADEEQDEEASRLAVQANAERVARLNRSRLALLQSRI